MSLKATRLMARLITHLCNQVGRSFILMYHTFIDCLKTSHSAQLIILIRTTVSFGAKEVAVQ